MGSERVAVGESLTVDREGPVLVVTLERGKANAIDAATSREMSGVFESFRDDDDLRVAILTAAGERFFSAGWDLGAAADGEAYESDHGAGGFGGFAELPGLTKPVILAVNGMAAGGGFEMMLAADLVVAAEHAEFLLPEATNGIIPDVGSVRLPSVLPRPLATEVLLCARRLTAAEALRHGLVNRVVPAGDVMPVARELADAVVAAAPLAVASILDVMRRTEGMPADEGLALLRSGNVESYERMLASDDALEGPRAFMEKRPPRWTGR
jgi:crotonobetainyl-CoA hydratase